LQQYSLHFDQYLGGTMCKLMNKSSSLYPFRTSMTTL